MLREGRFETKLKHADHFFFFLLGNTFGCSNHPRPQMVAKKEDLSLLWVLPLTPSRHRPNRDRLPP